MQKPSIMVLLNTSYQNVSIPDLLESIKNVYGRDTVFLPTPPEKQKEMLEAVFSDRLKVANPAEITAENAGTSVSIRPARISESIMQMAAAVSIEADNIRDYMNGPSASSVPLMQQIDGILDSRLFTADADDIVTNGPEALSAFRFLTKLADRIHAEKMAGNSVTKPFILPVAGVYQILQYEMTKHIILWTKDDKSEKLTAATQTAPGKYIILPLNRNPEEAISACMNAALRFKAKTAENTFTADLIYSHGLNNRFVSIKPGEHAKPVKISPQEQSLAEELVRETNRYLTDSVLTTEEIRKYM